MASKAAIRGHTKNPTSVLKQVMALAYSLQIEIEKNRTEIEKTRTAIEETKTELARLMHCRY